MEANKLLTKDELVKRAKELSESDNLGKALAEVRNLRKQWRKTGSEEESLYDKEMSEKFFGYLDVLNAKESEAVLSVEENKKALIEKAKGILNEKSYKKATTAMNELMDEWKTSGSAGRETDDALWAEFKAVRDEFFANRKAYYNNLTEGFKKSREAKEALIEKAKEINAMENMKEAGNAMNALMDEWKKAGSAGREHEEELWKLFSEERKAFFKKRNAYYDGLKEMFAKRTQAKKEIIAEAKMLLARGEFTDEEVSAIKGLRAKWKEVGSAGKENEDALWNEFNSILNKYFENMKYYG